MTEVLAERFTKVPAALASQARAITGTLLRLQGPLSRSTVLAFTVTALVTASACSPMSRTGSGSTGVEERETQTTPSHSPSIEDLDSPTPETRVLPKSRVAAVCLRQNKKLAKRFFALLDETELTPESVLALYEEYADIAFQYALNAGALGVELDEEGAVRKGDDCLYGAALGLKILLDAYPPDDPNVPGFKREIREHLGRLLDYYPDSPHVNDAERILSETA